MSERFSVAYEQVAQDVEKLVTLLRESQENQQMFMSEAYRLLQAQSHDVEELRGRAITWEALLQKLDDVMDAVNLILAILKQLNVSIDIQPPVGTIPPGGQPGVTLPGMLQPGAMQPGMTQPGITQPGAGGMLPGMSGTAPGLTGTTPGMAGTSPSQTDLPPNMAGISPDMMGTSPSLAGTPQGVGGTYPSTGGTFPSAGGTYPSTGGTSPSAGGIYPSTGGAYPSTGGTYPSTGGTYPSTGGAYPSAGGTYPGMAGTSPGLTGGAPTGGTSPTTPIFEQAGPHPEFTLPRESSAFFQESVQHESSVFLQNHLDYQSQPRLESAAFPQAELIQQSQPRAEAPSIVTDEQAAAVAFPQAELVQQSNPRPQPAEVAEPAPAKQAPSTGGQVRFLHASPGAPDVDIYIDGNKAASDVSFEGISTYLPLAPGRHRIQVFPFGSTANPLIDTSLDIKPRRHYTIAVTGHQRSIRPLVIEDQRGGRPGFARLKVAHLAPNAPGVDVTLPSGRVLIGDLTFMEKSPYLQVTPGTRDLVLRPAGKPDVVLRIPKIKFDPNITYTLYVLQEDTRLRPLLVPEA